MSAEWSPPFRTTRSLLRYAGEFLELYDDDVKYADGRAGTHLRARTPGPGLGVVVVPVHSEEFGMVLTYRHPTQSWEWGFPRGFAHDADPLITAAAELQEEMGVQAVDLQVLGEMTPNSGLLSDRVVVVRAAVAERGIPRDTDEIHDARWSPWSDLMEEIARGRISDGFTLASVALLIAKESDRG